MTKNLISHSGTSSQMGPIMTSFHKNRFEWAIKAKSEFISNTKDMNQSLEEVFLDVQRDSVNESSFNQLTQLLKEEEEASKQELKHLVTQLEKLDTLIEKQTSILHQERKEAEQQYNHIHSEIQIYDDFSKRIVFKDINLEQIRQLVNETITYTNSTRRASVINDAAVKLQLFIETQLKEELRNINQEAGILELSLGTALRLPDVPPVPSIIQKIDTFWLKSSYEKALNETRDNACDWVKMMYLNFNILLTPILNEVIKRKQHLIKKVEELKFTSEEKRKQQENQLATYQMEKAELDADYHEVCEMLNQYRAHASQLQRYFIKHWMEYKEELEKHFLYGNSEERWLASHYLQLLLHDGKNIIESLDG